MDKVKGYAIAIGGGLAISFVILACGYGGLYIFADVIRYIIH